MTKPLSILLDTNIWVDYYSAKRKQADISFNLIDECLRKGIQLLYVATTLKDIFYLVGMTQKRELLADQGKITEGEAGAINEAAWACIRRTREIAAAIPVTDPVLSGAFALKSILTDFEDDVILAAAEMAHVDFFVTSDRKLITKATVPALFPEDMLIYLQSL